MKGKFQFSRWTESWRKCFNVFADVRVFTILENESILAWCIIKTSLREGANLRQPVCVYVKKLYFSKWNKMGSRMIFFHKFQSYDSSLKYWQSFLSLSVQLYTIPLHRINVSLELSIFEREKTQAWDLFFFLRPLLFARKIREVSSSWRIVRAKSRRIENAMEINICENNGASSRGTKRASVDRTHGNSVKSFQLSPFLFFLPSASRIAFFKRRSRAWKRPLCPSTSHN